MPKVNPEIETFARIKVIGVGGSGKNALNHMINAGVDGVEFICMNTDTQDLHHSLADKKIHIGRNLTKGLGTGMNPQIGEESAMETQAEIQESIKGADMVFIACGMGGGTGTGAAPVVARLAKEQGILTVGVVTKPFSFEGNQRGKIAESGLGSLEKEVDALIVIPNDRILALTSKDTSFRDAFAMCDEVLRQAVVGISELITTPGVFNNIDFADIKTIMKDSGVAFMGIGSSSGENRAEEAAYNAINSPLLDMAINGARGILAAISGNDDLTMHEVNQTAGILTESVDPDAKVILGIIRDEKLKKGEIKVTVIATGFNQNAANQAKKNLFSSNPMGAVVKKPAVAEETKPAAEKNPEPERQTISIDKNPQRDDIEEIGDDGEWNMPAFLRRNKR
jgi:cell division protein FtsZ